MNGYYVFGTDYFCRLLRFMARLFYRFSLFEQTHHNSSQTFGEKVLTIARLGQLEQEDLGAELELWIYWQAAGLHKHPQDYVKVHALTDAWNGVFQNKNKKLLLQSLIQKI